MPEQIILLEIQQVLILDVQQATALPVQKMTRVSLSLSGMALLLGCVCLFQITRRSEEREFFFQAHWSEE